MIGLFASAAILLSMVVSGVHSFSTTSTTTTTMPQNKQLSAVLFDIDGTLVNSDPIHFAVFQELLLKEEDFELSKFIKSNSNNTDGPIDEAFFRTYISGRANPLIAADFFPDWSIAKREAWSIKKEARFREVAQATMMDSKMPGLDRLQAWMDQRDLPKAAVTNAPRLNAEAILSGIGYASWFDEYLIIGDECERPKPDPSPYWTACKLLGVRPEDCIVVEDSPSGARAGVAAGAFVVGILSGQKASALLEAGCHLIIDDFNDPKLWSHLVSISVASSSSCQ
jgi:HAD superfamily hydrolase (TIGR01509 family)